MTANDPFARYRAKTRRSVLAGAVGIVSVIAVVGGLLWWRSPERVTEKKRAFIDATRGRYCKVLESERAMQPSARVPMQRPAEPLVLTGLGVVFFDDYESGDAQREGTMDEIQIEALAALCEGRSADGQSLYSVFGGIVEPNEARRRHYTKKGLARAIAKMERVQYLLVVRIAQMKQTVAVGERGLAPGRFEAYAAVWRLSDGAFVDGVDVAGDGPRFAYLNKGLEDLQLAVQTTDALRKAIAGAFEQKGIVVDVR